MNNNRDFDKKIDINIIIKISLIKKKFCVFIKLRNNLETFIINSLIDIKKKDFFLSIISLLETWKIK